MTAEAVVVLQQSAFHSSSIYIVGRWAVPYLLAVPGLILLHFLIYNINAVFLSSTQIVYRLGSVVSVLLPSLLTSTEVETAVSWDRLCALNGSTCGFVRSWLCRSPQTLQQQQEQQTVVRCLTCVGRVAIDKCRCYSCCPKRRVWFSRVLKDIVLGNREGIKYSAQLGNCSNS